jgi:hypothetical protein
MDAFQNFIVDLFGGSEGMWDVVLGTLIVLIIVGVVKVIVLLSDASL